jgi:hypothetical protein
MHSGHATALVVTKSRNDLCFSIADSAVWNSLLDSIGQCKSLSYSQSAGNTPVISLLIFDHMTYGCKGAIQVFNLCS